MIFTTCQLYLCTAFLRTQHFLLAGASPFVARVNDQGTASATAFPCFSAFQLVLPSACSYFPVAARHQAMSSSLQLVFCT
jgi:hypothetical protein